MGENKSTERLDEIEPQHHPTNDAQTRMFETLTHNINLAIRGERRDWIICTAAVTLGTAALGAAIYRHKRNKD